MEHIIALVKFLLSLEPEKRKDFIPVIPFALIDILAGFYMRCIPKPLPSITSPNSAICGSIAVTGSLAELPEMK